MGMKEVEIERERERAREKQSVTENGTDFQAENNTSGASLLS